MKILTLKFLLPLAVILFFAGAISQAIENPEFEEYERTYPKYVKSNKPLSVLNQKDVQAIRKAENDLPFKILPFPLTMPYGNFEIQKLDIFRKSNDIKNPVIFFIHAGAEDKTTVDVAVPEWLNLGYLVVSINHRAVPKSTFPEMVEDCNLALKWVMNHIQNYGGDPTRIAVTGHSCGAHLAALLVTDTQSHKKYGIDISNIKCWFPMSGFYDMGLPENLLSPTIKSYIQAICVPSKEAASPVALVTGKEPPCLILHGADDWCVPKTNAISLYNKLRGGATLAILDGYMHANIFYAYLEPDHEPARLIRKFLATHLPTPQNPPQEF